MDFGTLRTAQGDALGDALYRALDEASEMSLIEGMRATGFNRIERMLHTLGGQQPELRTAAPLMDKAQVLIDKAVVEVGLQRLTVVADIMAEGLVFPLPDALGVMQLESSTMNKVGAAQRTMSPNARGENKLPIVLPGRLPIYLTTDFFQMDIRLLKSSQRNGTPLDTALVKQCTRSVNEAIEDAMINGTTTLDGQVLYNAGYNAPGLLTAPSANTQSMTVAAWTTAPVGATVQAEVLSAIGKLQGDKKFGPYNLYVGTVIGNALNTDFKANGNDSILQRLSEINVGGRNLRIRTADMMPASTAVLVQMTDEVVQIVNGQAPTVIPWTSNNGMEFFNMVMAIMIPRVRADYDGNSGVCILS